MILSALVKQVLVMRKGRPQATGGGDPPSGLIVVADGVGGLDLCGTGLKFAAQSAGLGHEIQVVPWCHSKGRWFRDLSDTENHMAWSCEVAQRVLAYRSRHPSLPIYLVGKSCGTRIIVGALEQLPRTTVERAVLIASALSPSYDLSAALRAVRLDLVSFWSPLDVILLGLGTTVFGTADRKHQPAAGLMGFRQARHDESRDYARLRQIRWHPSMSSKGYLGGHISPDLPPFLAAYVLPLLGLEPL